LDNIDSILEKKPESRVLLLTSHWLLLPWRWRQCVPLKCQ
jgi:hypothetical protein